MKEHTVQSISYITVEASRACDDSSHLPVATIFERKPKFGVDGKIKQQDFFQSKQVEFAQFQQIST